MAQESGVGRVAVARAGREGMATQRESVIAFLPVHNEQEFIEPLLAELKEVLTRSIVDEVLVVDDGSTDRTKAILAACSHCTVITHPRRQGCGDAIRSAYDYALEREYPVFVIMSGNGKDSPAQIERLVRPILNGEADYVQGSRYLVGGESIRLPRHRDIAIRLFTWAFSVAVWRRHTDCTNGFRAYRTSLLRDPRIRWDQEWLGHSYEVEFYLHYKATRLGYQVREVPVSKIYREARPTAHTKVRARDWVTNLKVLAYLRLGLKD